MIGTVKGQGEDEVKKKSLPFSPINTEFTA